MHVPLSAKVVERILSGVNGGEFGAADLLPSERDLALSMGVSRTTVAAAYSELEKRGAIRRIRGKGAYLCAPPSGAESFSWSGKVSRFANSLDEPVLELLARGCVGDLRYPLSAGTPSLEVFPYVEYATSVAHVLETSMPSALSVAPTEGQWELRDALAGWLDVPRQHVMITAGAQEGIDLVARCLIEQGDVVIADAPCYPGALQSLLSAGARLIPWGTDWSLVQLEGLILRYRPKLIFTTPTYQNPTGRVMSLKNRKGLLELAQRYRVPVLEDDVYGRAWLDDHEAPASLYKLDRHSLVINVSTFSKMLAPGLRVGWLTAPLYMIKQLALIKMRSNLFTGGPAQLVLAHLIRSGVLDEHLRRLRTHHRELRDVALAALQPSFDHGLLRCRTPKGGLYLWCKVLVRLDIERLFEELESEGISVAPGTAFEIDRQRRSSAHFRICFTAVGKAALTEAIVHLNAALSRLALSDEAAVPSGACL